MDKRTIFLLFCIVSVFTQDDQNEAVTPVGPPPPGEEGGKKGPPDFWMCDETILAEQNRCIFVRQDGKPMGPHIVDLTVGPIGHRRIQDEDGNLRDLGGKPAYDCDILVASEEEVFENDLRYVQVMEMMMPVQDYAFFQPYDLQYWDMMTLMLTHCNIKTEDAPPDTDQFSTQQIKDLMMNPEQADIHHAVKRYLDESQNELLCIMTTDGEWDSHDHCPAYREKHGLQPGESSDCWTDHYNNLESILKEFYMGYGIQWLIQPTECFPQPDCETPTMFFDDCFWQGEGQSIDTEDCVGVSQEVNVHSVCIPDKQAAGYQEREAFQVLAESIKNPECYGNFEYEMFTVTD